MPIKFPGETFPPIKPDLEFVESFDNSSVGGIEKFGAIETGVVSIDDVLPLSGGTMTGLLNISSGGLALTGGILRVYRTAVASDYNNVSEVIIGVTSTASARTVQLMTASLAAGKVVIVKDESGGAGSNNITISTEGSETIDGAASATISSNYGAVRLYCDGSNWFTF